MTETGMQSGGADRQPIVRIAEGEIRADSRDVASFFRRQHKNVLQAIANLECSAEFRRLNFQPFKNKDLTGESTSHVLMTKDGFAFLVMGFTGAAAAVFKEAYIAQFNAMEAQVRAQPIVDPMRLLNDPAALRHLLVGYSEKVIGLEGQIAEQAPKVEAFARIAEADGSMCVTEAAKTLQVRPSDLFRHLRTRGWIYRRAGAREDLGYQTRIAAGLLEHKVSMQHRGDGSERVCTQVRVTPKGLARLTQDFHRA